MSKTILLSLLTVFAIALWIVVFITQRNSSDNGQRLERGATFVKEGNPKQAETEWLIVAKRSPNNPVVWELLAELYINTEQWAKANSALRELQKIAPLRPQIYSRMAACSLRLGNEPEAQRLAKEELKVNPEDQSSLAILAFLANMQESSVDQVGYLYRILAKHPEDSDNLLSLSQALYESGKYQEAIDAATKLLAITPSNAMAFSIRASSRYEIDATPDASSLSEKDILNALKAKPLSAFSRYTLGQINLRQGKLKEGIKQLELAEKLNPRKLDIPFALQKAYLKDGQPQKSEAERIRFVKLREDTTLKNVLQKKCTVERNNFDIHLQLGLMMLEDENYRKATYYIDRALILQPRNKDAIKASEKLKLASGR